MKRLFAGIIIAVGLAISTNIMAEGDSMILDIERDANLTTGINMEADWGSSWFDTKLGGVDFFNDDHRYLVVSKKAGADSIPFARLKTMRAGKVQVDLNTYTTTPGVLYLCTDGLAGDVWECDNHAMVLTYNWSHVHLEATSEAQQHWYLYWHNDTVDDNSGIARVVDPNERARLYVAVNQTPIDQPQPSEPTEEPTDEPQTTTPPAAIPGHIDTNLNGGAGSLGPIVFILPFLVFASQLGAGTLFVGAGAGKSWSNPKPVNLPELDKSSSTDGAYELRGGVEGEDGKFRLLGVYRSQGVADTGDVKYNSYGVEVDYKILGPLFVGAGYSKMGTSSNRYTVNQVNDGQRTLQVGFRNMLTRRIEVEGKYTYMDKDAGLATIGLNWHFGKQEKSHAPVIVSQATPAPKKPTAEPAPVTIPSLPATYFAFDSAILNKRGVELVQRNAKLIRENGGKVLVTGHASKEGTEAYNMDLSRRRAETVRRVLAGLGIDAKVEAKGETEPVCAGDSPKCLARNRRVEFNILD